MSRFIILLGGDLIRTPYLDAQIAGSRVIAVDSGICHAAALRLVPELWLGDFDSVPKKLENVYPDVPREVFPTEKDKTDGELAVETALARGATHLVLAGVAAGVGAVTPRSRPCVSPSFARSKACRKRCFSRADQRCAGRPSAVVRTFQLRL